MNHTTHTTPSKDIGMMFCWVTLVVALVLLAVLKPTGHAVKTDPDAALARLQEGNERFAAGESVYPHLDAKRLALAGKEDQGKHAFATVIACSDSRVPVERIFDTGVMDLFVIRVAGNVVNTDEAGSIEYGLAHVHTPLLVVLGHTQCGAVTAVTKELQGHGHALERNIPPLIAPIKPAVARAMKEHPDLAQGSGIIPYAIEQNVWQAIEDLFLQSAASRALVEEEKVKVVGAIYDVGTGKVAWLPEEPVEEILAKVVDNPERSMSPLAIETGAKPAAHAHQ